MPMRYVTVTAVALTLLLIVGATQFRSSGENSQQLAAQTVDPLPTFELQQQSADLVSDGGANQTSALVPTMPARTSSAVPVETTVPIWTDDREHDENQDRSESHDDEQEEHDEDDD